MRRRDEKFPDNGFEAWGGYMQAKIAKLEDQFSRKNEVKLSNIFKGISIYVNGFTIPSADELKELMLRHGGVYHTYQRNEDFIIASNLPDTKVKNMSLAKVIKPEWVTASITANRLLDYRDYLLYRNSRTQPRLNFNATTKIQKDYKYDGEIKHSDDFNVRNEMCNIDKSVSEVKSGLKDYLCTIIEEIIIKDEKSNDNSTKKAAHYSKTAADPNFISEFYNNSRLHHISQLGAYFKQYVNDLRESSDVKFCARENLKQKAMALYTSNGNKRFERGKAIMHIDMDCFFVSVGLRKRPDLIGKPVAVTHSKRGQSSSKRSGVDRSIEFNLYKQKQAKKLGKSVGIDEEVVFPSRVDDIADEGDKYGSMSEIASCSYEARAKGIKNGMFMGAALKLCPDLQTIPYDFEDYKEVAYTLYNTIVQYSLDIEAVSCDEMYVDCTELLSDLCVSPEGFATVLRDEIKLKTGCPCSIGFGGNRLQARLATKKAKPDGQFFLTEDLVEDFMFDIKLSDLPGVGRQISMRLETLGHKTCGSLQSLTLASLKQHFGNKTGSHLFDQCRGRDLNPLSFHIIRKSVSAEVNYGIRFENEDQCVDFLKQLSKEVESRMQQFKVVGKCITLKLMVRAEDAPVETAKFMGHGFCNIMNKSCNLNIATNNSDIIAKEVISLCKKLNIQPEEMRGLGIQVTKLEQIKSKPKNSALDKFLHNATKVKPANKTPINRKFLTEFSLDKPAHEAVLKSITPKKVNCNRSPIKTSPVMKLSKSPSGKKRGRPSKNSKILNSTSKNLINKFLFGQDSGSMWKHEPKTNYQSESKKSEDKPLEKTLEKPLVQQPQCDKSKGLLDLPWEKVRELLMAWLDSGQPPKQCDVDMITNYMQEMVVNKNIDKLYILLNFLRRRTREKNMEMWIEVHNYVSERVQNAMVAVYGKKLYAPY